MIGSPFVLHFTCTWIFSTNNYNKNSSYNEKKQQQHRTKINNEQLFSWSKWRVEATNLYNWINVQFSSQILWFVQRNSVLIDHSASIRLTVCRTRILLSRRLVVAFFLVSLSLNKRMYYGERLSAGIYSMCFEIYLCSGSYHCLHDSIQQHQQQLQQQQKQYNNNSKYTFKISHESKKLDSNEYSKNFLLVRSFKGNAHRKYLNTAKVKSTHLYRRCSDAFSKRKSTWLFFFSFAWFS